MDMVRKFVEKAVCQLETLPVVTPCGSGTPDTLVVLNSGLAAFSLYSGLDPEPFAHLHYISSDM